jgi:hypothetical protein
MYAHLGNPGISAIVLISRHVSRTGVFVGVCMFVYAYKRVIPIVS